MVHSKGKAIPKLVKCTEAALVVAFFVFIWCIRLYFYAYSRTEQFRWLVMSILPIAKDKEK